MTRILLSADHHWDMSKRWDECQRIHGWMVEAAHDLKIDLFISAGDIYERASTPEEREAVSCWLIAMAHICPVIVVKGNHDRHLDCAIMSKLRSRHPIRVCEDWDVVKVNDTAIALIAWPERARIIERAQFDGVSPDQLSSEALRHLLMGLGAELQEHQGPRLVVGHLMIDGSETSTGQPLLGQPLRVGLADLWAMGADLIVAGHVHKPQHWQGADCTVLYTGSPYRTSYGEGEEKSVVVIDTDVVDAELDTARPRLSWKRVATPCSHMHLISERWTVDDARGPGFDANLPAWIDEDDVPGSYVRLRYEVEPDQRKLARAEAERWKQTLTGHGAREVKLEEVVISSVRARAPEIAQALTLPDKLMALWKSRGDVPPEARLPRLLAKIEELDS